MHNTLTHIHLYVPSPSNIYSTPNTLTDLCGKLCYPLLWGIGREGGISGKLLWKSWVFEPQQCLEGAKQLRIFPTRYEQKVFAHHGGTVKKHMQSPQHRHI